MNSQRLLDNSLEAPAFAPWTPNHGGQMLYAVPGRALPVDYQPVPYLAPINVEYMGPRVAHWNGTSGTQEQSIAQYNSAADDAAIIKRVMPIPRVNFGAYGRPQKFCPGLNTMGHGNFEAPKRYDFLRPATAAASKGFSIEDVVTDCECPGYSY